MTHQVIDVIKLMLAENIKHFGMGPLVTAGVGYDLKDQALSPAEYRLVFLKLSAAPRRKARIEIIPLIDVVFFLLATFVMVLLSMIKNRGVPVNLPVASTSTPQEHKDDATLTVKENDDYFFDKERVADATLPSKLAAFRAARKAPRIFIRADRDANWGRAVGALDAVRKSGIRRVAIETKPE